MAHSAGTIPAVKDRPKVQKRSTLLAIKDQPRIAKQAPIPVPQAPPPIKDQPAPANEPSLSAPASGLPVVEEAPRVALLKSTPVTTIPEVKKRPKVAKKPTIVAPTMPGKKPLVKTKTAPKEKMTATANWLSWSPIAVGILLGFLAPQIHSMAAMWDPWGLRAVFPIVQVLGLHEIGMSDELTRTLPQLMLYLQFPLEGILVASSLRSGLKLHAAIGSVISLHFVCGLVLWLVALGSQRPI